LGTGEDFMDASLVPTTPVMHVLLVLLTPVMQALPESATPAMSAILIGLLLSGINDTGEA
jgi:hypothetical protein